MLSHSSLTPIQIGLHKVQKRIAFYLGILSDWATFIGTVLILGLGTSWYMIDVGSPLTTKQQGPWTGWVSAGRSDADPYTRAHFARLGSLQLSTELIKTYVAERDDDGGRLHSSCEYVVEGSLLDTDWWSLTAFDDRGELIPNSAKRFSYTSDTVAVRPDGSFIASLGRDARPGNWLPTGGAGSLTLVLTTLDPGTPLLDDANGTQLSLPEIRRLKCR